MALPYSGDLRVRVIRAWKKLSTRELSERFGISEATVKRYKRQHRELKHVRPKGHGGGARLKIQGDDELKLSLLVAQHPDWTEEELRRVFVKGTGIEVSRATLGRAIRRLGYVVKKRPFEQRSGTESTFDAGLRNMRVPSAAYPPGVLFLWTKRTRTRG